MMKTRNLTISLMMLSLAAAALLAGAAADADAQVILLPSEGDEGLAGHEVTAALAAAEAWDEKKKMGSEDEEPAAGKIEDEPARPWACCNTTWCDKAFPPTCRCLDEVEECATACQECKPSLLNPVRKVCNDQYHGLPGPTCGQQDDDSGVASRSVAAAAPLLSAFAALLFL